MLSVTKQIAAGDAVRDYVARLRWLTGTTVVSSALMPWQPKREWPTHAPIPGTHAGAPTLRDGTSA
jgi:hypothetical protein